MTHSAPFPEWFCPGPNFLAAGDGSLPPLFTLLAVMLTAVVVVSLLLLRVQRSLLVGYFLCGVLIANSGLLDFLGGGKEGPHEEINRMAEFGVMLLMFVLGMEFSVSELKFLRRFALVGGGWQMALCALAAMTVAKLGGLNWPASIIIGVALGMSSTAVSLKSFQDMELSNTPGARFALGVAIFQDLFIIAFLVVMPLLTAGEAAADSSLLRELGMLLARGAAFVVLAWICARWIIPNVLQAVAHTRSRELFTLAVIGSCIGLAWAGALLQLSLALGAFVAGLAVSESVFKHRIMADIMPIKDLFLTLFFVSVGLLIDVPLALDNWKAILVISVCLLVGKAVVISGIALALRQLNRTALLAGFSLCSAGEFSLLLLQKAGQAGLWEASLQQALLTSATLSMALVPGLMRLADPLADWLDRKGFGGRRGIPSGTDSPAEATVRQRVKSIEGHAIICGYGPVGRALNRAMLAAGIPTLVIELNAGTVQNLLNEGQPVLFADVTHEETWELTRLESAVLVAFTFPDAVATGHGLRHVRALNPEICTMARTRFAADRARLEQLGANLVIHDEGEVAGAAVEQVLRIVVNPVK